VPGVITVAVLAWGVREEPGAPVDSPPRAVLETEPVSSGTLDRNFWTYLAIVGLFTLGNSADVFLLLRAQEAGVALAAVPLLWSFHHLVKAAVSTWGGTLSDRIGRRKAIIAGWLVYALSYAGFAWARQPWHAWALFAVYGIYHALCEGAQRALVADLTGSGRRGTAYGLFHAVSGLTLLPASLLAGGLWQAYGPAAALSLGAALALLAALALALFVREPAVPRSRP